jgi:hypothetical protein
MRGRNYASKYGTHIHQLHRAVVSAVRFTPCVESCAGLRAAVTLIYGVFNDASVTEVGDSVTFSSSVTGISCVIVQIVEFWK